jgi:hypothetical protein
LEVANEPSERQTLTATLRMGVEGILRVTLKAGASLNLEHAKLNLAATTALAAGQRVPVLIDLRPGRSLDREARALYSGDQTGKVVCAVALLIGSPLSRAIGNMFMGLNKPAYPLRLFSSEAEAVAWLAGFLG